MWHTDAFRQRYLLEVARRMKSSEGPEIARRALALIDKWERQDGVDPRYIETWRQVIGDGAEGVSRIATSATPEAAEMRHCMLFAGLLSNRERAEFRRTWAG